MTPKELLKRYAIKLPHNLGKPLYIQDIDVKKQFFKEIWKRLGALVFLLFGSCLALIMIYSTWQTHNIWHGIIAICLSGFLVMATMMLISFLHVTLYVVADKGIGRYTIHYNKRLIKAEILYFTLSMHCKVTEGYVDPHSPVSKKGYKIEAKWYENNSPVFAISYLKHEEPLLDKKALDEAVKAFQMYRLNKRMV